MVSTLIDEQARYLKQSYDAFKKEFISTLRQGLSAFTLDCKLFKILLLFSLKTEVSGISISFQIDF